MKHAQQETSPKSTGQQGSREAASPAVAACPVIAVMKEQKKHTHQERSRESTEPQGISDTLNGGASNIRKEAQLTTTT